MAGSDEGSSAPSFSGLPAGRCMEHEATAAGELCVNFIVGCLQHPRLGGGKAATKIHEEPPPGVYGPGSGLTGVRVHN